MTATSPRLFGSPQKRKEDPRLITGRSAYVDDVMLPGLLYAAMVRARTRTPASARSTPTPPRPRPASSPSTPAPTSATRLGELPCGFNLPDAGQIDADRTRRSSATASRYVGDIVAVVVADSHYAARDAADKVEVDYEVLPVVVDQEKAIEPGAPQLHDRCAEQHLLHLASRRRHAPTPRWRARQ